ncbi:synaptotagmin-like protein 4 isoform X1 [Myxocyprinus asiaticus]|uniref:synaptotagmin-like protein 4 isoform X1 n=1 Tax=Myxocyprinus asiaticus TaxID=70543 RepID=UPI0022225DCC|nr:synaptotagmin-like protein 4 isoform X1 [Myxocyprinus asiaticus]XP_051505575.1 synaptotagmin-like protein 4 isoform X1 [Myxocyprinus asiaticus]
MVQNMEINVSSLTDSEQDFILEVLQRDEKLRRLEEQRVKRLKAELLEVRRKGAKRGSGKYSERSCGRCQEPMGLLIRGGSQCRACKHHVCRKCQSVRSNGSWVCTVCAKEIDLKMSTGDWFYDERVNRFSTAPGHNLVRVSLRKKSPFKRRETAGELLLNKTALNSHQAVPMPKPRLKDITQTNKSSPPEVNEGLDVREQQRSDTESAEKSSLSSSHTESSRSTPLMQRKEVTAQISPAGSTVSRLTVPTNTNSISSSTSVTEAASLIHHMNVCSDSLRDVDGIFKKSIRKVHKLSDIKPASTLDLRKDGTESTVSSLRDRCKSVPGLNADDDEEDEDIDNLVNIHRQKFGDSWGNLQGSRSTLGSTMSVYSEAGDYDSVEVSGEIIFSLCYDDHSQSLTILVHECRGLAYVDAAKKKCNPYVKAYLLPDKSKKKTSIKLKTINPSFKETLKYSINRTQLPTRTLQLSVWHYDRFGRNVFLGEVEVPMDDHDIDSAHEECMALRRKAATPSALSPFNQYKGELVVLLKYVTANNLENAKGKGKKARPEDGAELHVLIKEAKNLTAMKAGGVSDSFVKGYLLPSKNKASFKRKTQVVKKTLNPHYDHTFIYKELSLEQLKDMCLELTVWDRETLSSNDFLGGVRLGLGAVTLKEEKEEWVADSTGEEISLWQKMMQYPDSWAEGTLLLRSSMRRGK